jgi:polyhydroxybutyrate depolymerase
MVLGSSFVSAQTLCAGADPCAVSFPADDELDGGQYYIQTPASWDGVTSLPVIVWFHGYQGSGASAINNRGLVQAWSNAGYLFVAADGRDNTWAHQGSPSQARDDTGYVRAVINDVQDRYPIDPERVVAAGFSQGGSMVWSVACFVGAPFTHYAPISGAFWEPLPASCDEGPIIMRHTHGMSDTVVPMAGRPIGALWHQGDVPDGLDILRETNGCAAAPDRTGLIVRRAACSVWSSCEDGALQLCLHDGGHGVPTGWSASTQAWIEDMVAAPTH